MAMKGMVKVPNKEVDAAEHRDVEVDKDDQKRINQFSRLNMKFDELEEEISTLKKNIQTYKDATEEIEACMELEDGILCRIGEAYTPADEDAVTAQLDGMREKAEARLIACADEIESTKTDMDALKKVLYAKFGSNINLEK
mmetsp:Transcript_113059/g.243557  ORF Transcript_113059/g.243557 Transcript_113059/m.243557 type:complete len:141 (+) Transcript_113059:126-548(+)